MHMITFIPILETCLNDKYHDIKFHFYVSRKNNYVRLGLHKC